MKTIIDQTVEKLKNSFYSFFSEEKHSIGEAEKYFSLTISEATVELLSAYYEEADRVLRENKKARKEKKLVIERRNEKREVQTTLGLLSVSRTYYQQNKEGYVYPIDEMMGIESYQRVSGETCDALVNTAVYESYGRTSQIVTNNAISRQTVMNKLRKYYPYEKEITERKEVPVLHIDVDEDHIHLQSGKGAIVPVACIYETIDRTTSRHTCVNSFYVSRFNLSPDAFWTVVLNEVEKRYNIENTQIYIHGDGAAWIKSGLEWFPGSIYVLDPFHKNKALKQAVANMSVEDRNRFQKEMRECLDEGDEGGLQSLQAEMCQSYPDLSQNILDSVGYLINNFDGIMVRNQDEEARRGGATEPHVSHGLSFRLSTRPRGWSAKTLEHFVPILAARMGTSQQPKAFEPCNPNDYLKVARKPKIRPNMWGLVHPDFANSVASSFGGKTNNTLFAFKSIWG